MKINDEYANKLMVGDACMVANVPRGYVFELTTALCVEISAEVKKLGRPLSDEEFVSVAERFRG